jgi:hypothetical protein
MSHTMLQNMRSMLTEYTTSGGTIDKLEDIYLPSDSVVAPGSVAEGSTDRNTAPAINLTRTIMARLLAVPSNKKVLDSLPPDQVWRTGNDVILLDGFRNPIIYVPRRGLTRVNLGAIGENKYPQATQNQTIAPAGGQPFFASAGEDGDFSKGDDNHYSYEQ